MKDIKTGYIISYSYTDSEFGDIYITDNFVFLSEESVNARMEEIKTDIKRDIFKYNHKFFINNVELRW